MTQPLLSAAVILLLPVVAIAGIHELRADPARIPIEEVVITPVGPRIAELDTACEAASHRLDELTDHGRVEPAKIDALIDTITDLRHRLDTVAADAAELRYCTRQAVEREQMPERAWRGGLTERDAHHLQDAVRTRLDRFSADKVALRRLEERIAGLTAAAADLAARPSAPIRAADPTP